MKNPILPRSVLFAPGDRPDLMTKAVLSRTDRVCFDLEDGVARQKKDQARKNLARGLKQASEAQKPVWVRINSDMCSAVRDIEAIVPGVQCLVVPKTRGWSQLAILQDTLKSRFPDPAERPEIVPLIEDLATIQRLLTVPAITGIDIAALALGTEDLSGDLGVKPNGVLLTMALYDLVKVGQVLSVPVLGFAGSIANYTDLDDLSDAVRASRLIGARGAFCIHPRQIDILNRGFSPSQEDVLWANGVMSVEDDVRTNGLAVHPETRQMIDLPILAQAKEVLARAMVD